MSDQPATAERSSTNNIENSPKRESRLAANEKQGDSPTKKLEWWLAEVPNIVEGSFSTAMGKLNENLTQQAQLRKSLRQNSHHPPLTVQTNPVLPDKQIDDTEYGQYSETNLSPVAQHQKKASTPKKPEGTIELIGIEEEAADKETTKGTKRGEVSKFVFESVLAVMASHSNKTTNLKQALMSKIEAPSEQHSFVHAKDSIQVARDRTMSKKDGVLQFMSGFIDKILESNSSKTSSLAQAMKKKTNLQDAVVEIQPKSKENPEHQLEESPIKQLKEPLPQKPNPFSQRKPSMKTVEQLKKAIKEYQKEDADDLVVDSPSRKNVTDHSNTISTSKLAANLSNIEHEELHSKGKSFKISRRNPMPALPQSYSKPTVATTGLPSLSVPKNTGELRNHSDTKKSSQVRLNEVKASYSHVKRNEQAEDRSIDSKLRRLRRDHQPKLDSQAMAKYDIRGREFENSLQMNIDFLLSLKKEGGTSRLIKRELVNDSKINKIVGNMVNSDSYQRIVDRDTRAFLQDIRMPTTKREVKGIVRQKPFSIYHPTQKNEPFRLH